MSCLQEGDWTKWSLKVLSNRKQCVISRLAAAAFSTASWDQPNSESSASLASNLALTILVTFPHQQNWPCMHHRPFLKTARKPPHHSHFPLQKGQFLCILSTVFICVFSLMKNWGMFSSLTPNSSCTHAVSSVTEASPLKCSIIQRSDVSHEAWVPT